MGLLKPHLDDAACAGVWADRWALGGAESDGPGETHLRDCGPCRARFAAFSGWLDTVRLDARAEADEAMTIERLAAQQAQIARRLEALDHPARVIAFPRHAAPVAAPTGGGRAWIASAAAAGLVVGLGLGQWMNFTPAADGRAVSEAAPQQIARGTVAAEPGLMSVQPASQLSDEAQLYEADLLPSQARVPESLQYLNAITPGSRDYDPR